MIEVARHSRMGEHALELRGEYQQDAGWSLIVVQRAPAHWIFRQG